MRTDNIPTETGYTYDGAHIFEKRRSTINVIMDHSPISRLIMGAAVNCLQIRVPVNSKSCDRRCFSYGLVCGEGSERQSRCIRTRQRRWLCARFVHRWSLSENVFYLP
jgi:hypothetical protein